MRECPPLVVRQNKVGGGQAPDQPETPDRQPETPDRKLETPDRKLETPNRRTEQKSHQRIFRKLLAQPMLGGPQQVS